MLKFAANISTMFAEPNELDRVTHAARLGFQWLEWLFPYNIEISEIQNALQTNELELILINAAAGERVQGEVGICALPHRVDEFKTAMESAFEYTNALGVPMIHVMAGILPNPNDRSRYIETMVENLAWASDQTDQDGPRLLVEPLNLVDTPNYLITSTDQAMEVIQGVNKNIGLQFDFYHLQVMQGNLGANLRKHFEHIAHVQFSSVPGRHEPQFGEVNCDFLFNYLEELGYEGYIGCEYRPKEDVDQGLSWAHQFGIGKP